MLRSTHWRMNYSFAQKGFSSVWGWSDIMAYEIWRLDRPKSTQWYSCHTVGVFFNV